MELARNRELIPKVCKNVNLPFPLSTSLSKLEIDSIDFEGKDAIKKGNFKQCLRLKAHAAALYFNASYYNEAGMSADRGAKAAFSLQLREDNKMVEYNLEERTLISSGAYLSEFAGNCYVHIKDFQNAHFAYLKASKEYLLYFKDVSTAKNLFIRAENISRNNNLPQDLFAERIIREVTAILQSSP